MPDISVRVPATTANLGPGFDCLGAALGLYNTLTLTESDAPWPDAFIAATAAAFYGACGRPARSWQLRITGDVPRSRGLGSSVTVRLGLLLALNEREGRPLPREVLLDLTIALEGHPDNAVPAYHGGFAASAPNGHIRTSIDETLKFIAVIPPFEVETKQARAVLPATVPFADAVRNLQQTALLTAAFMEHNYPLLRGHFEDHLHQPHRLPLIPGGARAIEAAVEAGALGACISGSGSTILALTLHSEHMIAAAMRTAFERNGTPNPVVHVLAADNTGAQVLPAS
jgi:homoserine kinase